MMRRKPIRRLGKVGKRKLEAMKLAKEIYLSQFNRCQYCGVEFAEGYRIEAHHKLKRSLGGKDDMTNLVIVHEICHSQIHRKHYIAVRDSPANAQNGEIVSFEVM